MGMDSLRLSAGTSILWAWIVLNYLRKRLQQHSWGTYPSMFLEFANFRPRIQHLPYPCLTPVLPDLHHRCPAQVTFDLLGFQHPHPPQRSADVNLYTEIELTPWTTPLLRRCLPPIPSPFPHPYSGPQKEGLCAYCRYARTTMNIVNLTSSREWSFFQLHLIQWL